MSKQKQKNPIFVNIKQHVLNLYFSENSNKQSLVICGLTDARMRAFEKDLPVPLSKSRIGQVLRKQMLQREFDASFVRKNILE